MHWVTFAFFFQAEDGIRDLVRSRGLGDVYKRQGQRRVHLPLHRKDRQREHMELVLDLQQQGAAMAHLSLIHI